MGKYRLTTIRTTLATSKRLNQLKKQIGAKSIDELLTTLMNMYHIKKFSEEDLKQLSICNDLITPPTNIDVVQEYVYNALTPRIIKTDTPQIDVDTYLETHELVWKGDQVVGIEKEQSNENKEATN